MWKVTLKDVREVRLRFLTADDKERLFRMFSSMSEKALEWSMAPYTMENIERWIDSLPMRLDKLLNTKTRLSVGQASTGFLIYAGKDQGIWASICIRIFTMLG